MTTRRLKHADRWRPPFGRAATVVLAALMLVGPACSGSSPATTDTAPVTREDSSAATMADDGTSSSDPDPARLLTDSIAAVGTRYEFDTSVALTDGTLTLVSGRVYDDASTYLITTAGSALEYVVTRQGRWVRDAGGDWVALEVVAPINNPLAPLASPIAIDVLSIDGTITLAATYPGEVLGFDVADEVTIEIAIVGSRLASLRYQAAAGDSIVTVETTVSNNLEIEPVNVPGTSG